MGWDGLDLETELGQHWSQKTGTPGLDLSCMRLPEKRHTLRQLKACLFLLGRYLFHPACSLFLLPLRTAQKSP